MIELENWKRKYAEVERRRDRAGQPLLYEGQEHSVLYNVMSKSGTIGKYGWHPYNKALEILNGMIWNDEYKEWDHISAMHRDYSPKNGMKTFMLSDELFKQYCKPELMWKVYADRNSMDGGHYIDSRLEHVESHIIEDIECGGLPVLEPVIMSQWELCLLPEFDGY